MPSIANSNAATKAEIRDLTEARGLITVDGASSTQYFLAAADGVTDDRSIILSALNAGAADMPCKIKFGAGVYAITDGVKPTILQGSRGFRIEGAGRDVCEIKFNKGSALNIGYIAIALAPSVNPTLGDYANYLKDISIRGIKFSDADPYAHQSFSAEFTGADTSSTANATVMTDTGASWTVNAFVNQQLRNTTDKSVGTILSNTATTITVDHMFIGTTNVWNSGDGYAISATIEESHGADIKYATNADISFCSGLDIGDESMNLSHVVGGALNNNTTIGCPSIGGGTTINTQGCSAVSVSRNIAQGATLYGVRSVVTGSSGIGTEIIGASDNVTDITLSDNIISGFEQAGYVENNAVSGKVMDTISYSGGSVRDCGNGILFSGSNLHKNGSVSAITISNTINAIASNLGATNTTGMKMQGLVIDTCSNQGVTISGTNISFVDVDISNVTNRAINIASSVGVTINGGVINECGNAGNVPVIGAFAYGYGVTISGTKILNSNSDSYSIANCENLYSVEIDQKVPTYRTVNSARRVINLTSNGGVQFKSTALNPCLKDSELDCGGVDMLTHMVTVNAGNDDFIITNNYINSSNATTNRRGINILLGADNGICTGNNVRSRTAGLGINNAGTGNVLANNLDL